MTLIRSISGLRATLGDDLTPELVSGYAAGLSAVAAAGEIIVGRDGRPSGEWIEQILTGTLAATGRCVRSLGIVPTPTVQLIVERRRAAAGVAITASHNPEMWNGLKFINTDGVFFDAAENQRLWEAVDKRNYSFKSDIVGNLLQTDTSAIEIHIDSILTLPLFSNENRSAIMGRKFHIVVDAVNTSGSLPVPMLAERLGCRVTRLFCRNDGIFPHTPEPVPENLSQLCSTVVESGADLGIAVDPDADRLVLIDETGTPIGEEKTIALATMAVLDNIGFFDVRGTPVVVVNHSTTRLVEDIAASYGATVIRSPVGEINVVKKMIQTGAVIGGEGSGGVILPSCHSGRDSLVGMALVLLLLAQRQLPLSRLSDKLPRYHITKRKKEFHGSITGLTDKIIRSFPNGTAFVEDGVKISFERSWLQLRLSNTEPIVRIIAEAPTKMEADELATFVQDMI